MEDTNDKKISSSGNVSVEEKLLKSEKIDNSSEDKIETTTETDHEEKPLLPSVEIKTAEKKETLKATTSNTRLETQISDEALKIVKVIKEPKTVARDKSEEEIAKNYVKKISDSVPCCPMTFKEKIIRNQSDIFSLKEVPTILQTSIYSVSGSPSRKVYRKTGSASHVFQRNEDPPAEKTTKPRDKKITRENYNDEKRPSSSCRNPLTGIGLSSNDEYKSKAIKRKDGNPLLGLGYDDDNKVTSRHKIPPGGYSHKLW